MGPDDAMTTDGRKSAEIIEDPITNEPRPQITTKMKCKYFNCSCDEYVASTSKWTRDQCSKCNHSKSLRVVIQGDVDRNNISRRGSVCNAYEILWRYQGHSYTISPAKSSYLMNELRDHVIRKLELNGKESELTFRLNGDIVSDFTMDIVTYSDRNNVRTVTIDVALKEGESGVVRTGR